MDTEAQQEPKAAFEAADIAPLSARNRSHRRALEREAPSTRPGEPTRSSRRLFLQRAGLTAVAVGMSSFVTVGRLARPAAAGNYDIKDDCRDVAVRWYKTNPPDRPCGPSWICNGSTWMGGCRDLNGYHREYLSNGQGWKYRPSMCPPGSDWDGWKWKQANYAGCAYADVRCHDGWKLVAGSEPLESIAAHRVRCY